MHEFCSQILRVLVGVATHGSLYQYVVLQNSFTPGSVHYNRGLAIGNDSPETPRTLLLGGMTPKQSYFELNAGAVLSSATIGGEGSLSLLGFLGNLEQYPWGLLPQSGQKNNRGPLEGKEDGGIALGAFFRENSHSKARGKKLMKEASSGQGAGSGDSSRISWQRGEKENSPLLSLGVSMTSLGSNHCKSLQVPKTSSTAKGNIQGYPPFT
ncbi:hypothetical protein VNO77_03842 [Canavalia gladiata]|uniref:Uncharacterized protein n=1 Tax=Canavalia gladiata TaxID=3824 RepID=A0AAN9R4A4_CANGL